MISSTLKVHNSRNWNGAILIIHDLCLPYFMLQTITREEENPYLGVVGLSNIKPPPKLPLNSASRGQLLLNLIPQNSSQ